MTKQEAKMGMKPNQIAAKTQNLLEEIT